MSSIRIELIGSLRVLGREGEDLTPRGRKTRALLACLALDAGTALSRSRLAGLIWDRSGESQARMSLRQSLSELNEVLDGTSSGLIVRGPDTLRLNASDCVIDVHEVLNPTVHLPGEEAWLKACKNQLLEELIGVSQAFDEWILVRRQDFRNRLQAIGEQHLEHLVGQSAEPSLIADAAMRLIQLDPTHEVAARARMRAFVDMGRKGEALREYERCREALRLLLDAEPSAETTKLGEAIRMHRTASTSIQFRTTTRETGERTAEPLGIAPASGDVMQRAMRSEIAVRSQSIVDSSPLLPVVGFIPLEPRDGSPQHHVLGEMIADEAVAQLSSSRLLRVISRLSTSAVRGRGLRVDEVGALLGSNVVVSGAYRVAGRRLSTMIEVADVTNQEVIWSGTFEGTESDVTAPGSPFVESICSCITNALSTAAVRRVHRVPLPTIDAFSLLLAAAALMHKPSVEEFKRSRVILEHLVETYPNSPEPHAWLAKWCVLQVTRGHSPPQDANATFALDHTSRALGNSPDCSLALAVEGFVHCHIRHDLDRATAALRNALAINPNEPLAWLFSSVVEIFRGENTTALGSARRAIQLSPLDPMRHYFDALASGAALVAEHYDEAIAMANRALQVNGTHLPTLRTLAIAQVESGDHESARRTMKRYLDLQPGFNLRDYLAGTPKGGERFRERCAAALRKAGVPEG